MEGDVLPQTEDVHLWFGLTYANYLVWPRSLMQSMPPSWQERFFRLASEWDEHWSARLDLFPDRYQVSCRDMRGRFVPHPAPHYARGRAFVSRERPDAV